ncbi:hypothetical protein AB670_00283 [Chryseobacterium sp. MOF25P]|nr:hypothetical protein AB670_00283 [Chryseobacterium sp. MOF25P]OBW47338.1 hypothetical protein AB671_00549 [Chryseobacterium sp. BGARF1]
MSSLKALNTFNRTFQMCKFGRFCILNYSLSACLKSKFIFNIKELRSFSLKILIKINSLISYLHLDQLTEILNVKTRIKVIKKY